MGVRQAFSSESNHVGVAKCGTNKRNRVSTRELSTEAAISHHAEQGKGAFEFKCYQIQILKRRTELSPPSINDNLQRERISADIMTSAISTP